MPHVVQNQTQNTVYVEVIVIEDVTIVIQFVLWCANKDVFAEGDIIGTMLNGVFLQVHAQIKI